eukprot:CAMPEP_0116978688 /NCGR_PEP_ID=MMETSP0467-20121206/57941_1 /TAXON_ID=283647 /ORGANISM="Mesodinium pulex, Strain SPMC105" /LENGTH=176 /DNA_ID=CAMNT_0004672127 /DNA_START=1560 /DNA_END=2087 /DNA_ORIENTATION=+
MEVDLKKNMATSRKQTQQDDDDMDKPKSIKTSKKTKKADTSGYKTHRTNKTKKADTSGYKTHRTNKTNRNEEVINLRETVYKTEKEKQKDLEIQKEIQFKKDRKMEVAKQISDKIAERLGLVKKSSDQHLKIDSEPIESEDNAKLFRSKLSTNIVNTLNKYKEKENQKEKEKEDFN